MVQPIASFPQMAAVTMNIVVALQQPNVVERDVVTRLMFAVAMQDVVMLAIYAGRQAVSQRQEPSISHTLTNLGNLQARTCSQEQTLKNLVGGEGFEPLTFLVY